jgi:hypothetical protein
VQHPLQSPAAGTFMKTERRALLWHLPLLLALTGLEQLVGAGKTAPQGVPELADTSPCGTFGLSQPIAVYNNWSAYDELSDNVELTEELALRQLREIARLRQAGVRIDYYLMDAFWYAPDGGYRTFRQPHWPNGPGRWLTECRALGVRPGLWLASNALSKLNPLPEWESSLTADRTALCLFEGGFLSHLLETLQMWYDRGVRLFKLDFANFGAATPGAAARLSSKQIQEANSEALRSALRRFRQRNPQALFSAFNGFGGRMDGTFYPIEQTVDPRWLLVFDALYCGDPRPADVPAFNFWRAKDIYTDHMVRYYAANGIPLERIDNTGFMVGLTGTCYRRGAEAWEGMLILEHARGGWLNQYYGNLELVDARKAAWFARVQKLFFPLLAQGRTLAFGGLPGRGEPYGFVSSDANGAVYTVVNPSQSFVIIPLPRPHRFHAAPADGRLLFRDAGYVPKFSDHGLWLGPEQLAVAGFGRYASSKWTLGVGKDICIPADTRPLSLRQVTRPQNQAEARVDVPAQHGLRILMRQTVGGVPRRSSGGAPPNGKPLDALLTIRAAQGGRPLPARAQYGKAIWSGLSWASVEVEAKHLRPREPVTLQGSSAERDSVELNLECYAIRY